MGSHFIRGDKPSGSIEYKQFSFQKKIGAFTFLQTWLRKIMQTITTVPSSISMLLWPKA